MAQNSSKNFTEYFGIVFQYFISYYILIFLNAGHWSSKNPPFPYAWGGFVGMGWDYRWGSERVSVSMERGGVDGAIAWGNSYAIQLNEQGASLRRQFSDVW